MGDISPRIPQVVLKTDWRYCPRVTPALRRCGSRIGIASKRIPCEMLGKLLKYRGVITCLSLSCTLERTLRVVRSTLSVMAVRQTTIRRPGGCKQHAVSRPDERATKTLNLTCHGRRSRTALASTLTSSSPSAGRPQKRQRRSVPHAPCVKAASSTHSTTAKSLESGAERPSASAVASDAYVQQIAVRVNLHPEAG